MRVIANHEITPLKTGGKLVCSRRVGSSCSTSGTLRVNLVTNPVISHKWGKNWEVLIRNSQIQFQYLFLDPIGFSRRLRAKTHTWYSKQERKRWKNFKKAFKKKKYNLKKLKRSSRKRDNTMAK
jgi:hypothetical protein